MDTLATIVATKRYHIKPLTMAALVNNHYDSRCCPFIHVCEIAPLSNELHGS